MWHYVTLSFPSTKQPQMTKHGSVHGAQKTPVILLIQYMKIAETYSNIVNYH